ncbi:hypothetical protein [Winogradskyella tangerina]|uniref:hypothetical protein n=1 Tax=Winogradskyella tangerina TaxID=2023240 RepID=UPI000DBE76BC|nr:hypothetical protein [Winogradskyella tangerina]
MNTSNEHTGLKTTDKALIFFFGIFLVLFAGNHYVYNLPGTKKQKQQGIIYYYLGLLFYILCIVGIYYFSSTN